MFRMYSTVFICFNLFQHASRCFNYSGSTILAVTSAWEHCTWHNYPLYFFPCGLAGWVCTWAAFYSVCFLRASFALSNFEAFWSPLNPSPTHWAQPSCRFNMASEGSGICSTSSIISTLLPLAALKIGSAWVSHHPHSNCPQGSLLTATSGSLLTASVQRTKNIEKRTTCTGAGFACHYQSRRCSKFCCTMVLAPCTKASRSRSRTTHSIHHCTRSMLSLSFSCPTSDTCVMDSQVSWGTLETFGDIW